MKKKHVYKVGDKTITKEINYIPFRFILALLITILEVFAIIGIVVALCYFVPYFYLLAFLTQVFCVMKIVTSNDNPEYKLPWLLLVLIVPVAGFMLYFIFYSRKLKRKYVNRLKGLYSITYPEQDDYIFENLKNQSNSTFNQAKLLTNLSYSHLFTNTTQKYFSSGEKMWKSMLINLKNAKNFIYLEYFIIEEGEFWNSILEILKEKAHNGLDVKVVFDDVGCMTTLPANYSKKLKKFGIKAVPFSRLKGQADNEFNNRSHRKIMVIDGKIAYTGGVNIADEYVNLKSRFGHWKDVGIRLEGEAVYEFTKLFLIDFGLSVKEKFDIPSQDILFPKCDVKENGFLIPFGDGPSPIYKCRTSQRLIMDMLANAKKYAYIMTPYLVIDNDLCLAIESASLKGVDVRIIVPHVPDKKIVFELTKTFYERLMKTGVKIYEYTPGFIHAKAYLIDGETAIIGTMNLDYRSLVHHFENGVWLYTTKCIRDIEKDFFETFEKCVLITESQTKKTLLQKVARSIIRVFAPLL